jgi:hypothetical protein
MMTTPSPPQISGWSNSRKRSFHEVSGESTGTSKRFHFDCDPVTIMPQRVVSQPSETFDSSTQTSTSSRNYISHQQSSQTPWWKRPWPKTSRLPNTNTHCFVCQLPTTHQQEQVCHQDTRSQYHQPTLLDYYDIVGSKPLSQLQQQQHTQHQQIRQQSSNQLPVSCAYCSHVLCVNCQRTCPTCQGVYCTFCAVACDNNDNSIICLTCKDDSFMHERGN